MARWLVYTIVIMQAAFLVCSEETETPTEVPANSTGVTTPTPATSVVPTRVPSVPTPVPPIDHSVPNTTEVTTTPKETKNNSTKGNNGAASPNAYIQTVVVSILGIVLYSAI